MVLHVKDERSLISSILLYLLSPSDLLNVTTFYKSRLNIKIDKLIAELATIEKALAKISPAEQRP